MSSSAAWPVRLFTGATVLWAATLPMATLAARDGRGWVEGMSAVVYAIGHVLCHQRPERSFAWLGQSWPVCARCTGIYIGAALGALLTPVGHPQRMPGASAVRLWLAVAALPTVITIVYEWTTGQMPAHAVRAVTGGLLGMMAAGLIVIFLREWRGRPPAGLTAEHEVN